MRLEGIDPRRPSVFCVLSVAEVRRDAIALGWFCGDSFVENNEFQHFLWRVSPT